jgi:4-alpha-glucanotransferase
MGDSFLSAERASGVLLHPTSLPGPGVGDLVVDGPRFVDWLERAGQRYWQILPLVPVDGGGSPYNGLSALAGNPLLISAEALAREGLAPETELRRGWELPGDHVDFAATLRWKQVVHTAAHRAFLAGAAPSLKAPFEEYRERNESWLPDFTLFRALRGHHHGAPWTSWPAEVAARDPAALERWRDLLSEEVDRHAFEQFLFERQWGELRGHASDRGIAIIGDIPIFVAHDSADVWANPEIFHLEADGTPSVVAGVPPDYFSETGQRWGNPLYRWDVLEARGYDWWVERFRRTLEMVDVVRIDHFRGFEAYWEIPREEETAIRGRWAPGPGARLFREVERQLGALPLIAEDLGLITDEVHELREELGYPGMRVFQFAFDGDADNPHLPRNHPADAVAYTGTHDNDTILGWWHSTSPSERRQARGVLGKSAPTEWGFIEATFRSAARTAIVPLQDVLGQGTEGRMNTPGRSADNWTWRFQRDQLTDAMADRLREIVARTGRNPRVAQRPSPPEGEEDTQS